MWAADGINLKMCEGDYGIALPFTFSGATFANNDAIKVTVKAASGSTQTVLEKTVTDITSGYALELTEQESALMPVGNYVYSLDWYRSGVFLCNLVARGLWKVVDKV